MNTILLKKLTARAKDEWKGGDITTENFQQWCTHWFTVAENMKAEFDAENLIETSNEMTKIIEAFKDH